MSVEKITETLQNPETARVVYLSGEQIPTPHSIFAYWALVKLGALDPQNCVIIPSSLKAERSELDEHIVFPKFDGKEGREFVSNLVNDLKESDQLDWKQKKLVSRIGNYLSHCNTNQRYTPRKTLENLKSSTLFYDLLVEASLRPGEGIQQALKNGAIVIEHYLAKDTDPFSHQNKTLTKTVTATISSRLNATFSKAVSVKQELMNALQSKNQTIVSVPLLKKQPDGTVAVGETREEQIVDVELDLGVVELFKNQKIGFAIVGPPNSGKSTVAANLKYYCEKTLADHGITGISVGLADFDARTPDAEKIASDSGFTHFEEHEKGKWSTQLAAQTVRNYYENSTDNIVIINTPGGNPDKITEILFMPIDGVMLLVAPHKNAKHPDQNWVERRDVWKKALRSYGVKTIALVRSRLEGEVSRVTGKEVKSAVTSLHWEKDSDGNLWLRHIGGRAIDLKRGLKEDKFFEQFAPLLLFDIAPKIVLDKMQSKSKYLKFLQKQYS